MNRQTEIRQTQYKITAEIISMYIRYIFTYVRYWFTYVFTYL